MSLLERISAGVAVHLHDALEQRTGVPIEVRGAHPTPEQVVDALFAKLGLGEAERAALQQANGGADIRQQLIAEFRRNGVNSAALEYVGGGRYRGYVGLSKETLQRLREWAHGDGRAPAETPTGPSARQQELQTQGALARHRAELALRTQEARQQIVTDVLGTGGAQMVGVALSRETPKAVPLVPEALPPLLVGTGMIASVAVVLDKGLELSVEQQMMSEKQGEPPAVDTTQPQPVAPAIPTDNELPKGELVPADEVPPSAPQGKDEPSETQTTEPQSEPPTPKFDAGRGIPTALTTASLGKLAADKMSETEGLKVPQGLSEAQFEQLSARVREGAGHYGSDIRVHGSRAAGTARPDSDIDIAIRVSPERFDQIIRERFGTPNPGSAKERAMRMAIETGKIQAGELGLRGFRRTLEKELGVEIDLSVVRNGGPFDQGPWTPLR